MRTLAATALVTMALAGASEAMAEKLNLTLTRTIDAPPARVWQALSEAELIRQWWGPTGFTAPKVETDFRVGGATLVCMTAPGFPVFCNTWTYAELVPNEKIVFDSGWADESGATIPVPPGLPADIPAIVPHVVELVALPDGKTELRWSEFGYASPETVAQSRMGLEQVLDKLVAAVK
jgi:uncharacterized protein YndB with AHSA1/START domain